jgi:Zn finger protein HypA/HybF involved in hydrogenase expression
MPNDFNELERMHLDKLKEYAEELTCSCECNSCGESFESDADVYKCERCGCNDINIDRGEE